MRRWSFPVVVLLVCGLPAFAKNPSPQPPVVRATTAPVVFVGEVTGIEKDTVETNWTGTPDQPKQAFHVAMVKVVTPLVGAKAVKEARVAFVRKPPAEVQELLSPPLQLAKGDVRCLFLQPHPEYDFYTEVGLCPTLDPAKKEDQPALELVKKAAAILADPVTALKAEKADDRVFAALCLAYNYGPAERANLKEEELPKEESELILKALRDADPAKLEREDGLFWIAAVEKFGLAKNERLGPWWGERGKDRNAKRFKLYADWYDKPGEKVRLTYWVPK